MCNVQSQCNLCIFDEQNGELFTIIQQTSSFVFLPQVPSPKSRVPSPNMSNVIDLTEEPRAEHSAEHSEEPRAEHSEEHSAEPRAEKHFFYFFLFFFIFFYFFLFFILFFL